MNIPNVNNGDNPYLINIGNAQLVHPNNPANPEEQVNNPEPEDIFTLSPEAERLQNETQEIHEQEQPNPGGPNAILEEENPTVEHTNPANEILPEAEEPLENPENIEENPEPPEPNNTNQLQQQRARVAARGMPNPGNILDLNA